MVRAGHGPRTKLKTKRCAKPRDGNQAGLTASAPAPVSLAGQPSDVGELRAEADSPPTPNPQLLGGESPTNGWKGKLEATGSGIANAPFADCCPVGWPLPLEVA